ncbi:MAG: EcsC family protein [Candidatus Riflebacteria bacterium]|nr:EcsC family protein [Candidatus Riflebacteria bacterium]
MEPSMYEKKALVEIERYLKPQTGIFSKIGNMISIPLEKVFELVEKIPGYETVIMKSVRGILELLNDASLWSVNSSSIHAYIRRHGIPDFDSCIRFRHDLELLDGHIGSLNLKYAVATAAEGGGAGLAGAVGIPVDAAAMFSMNMRAIGEYATYYGYNIEQPVERLFALNVLQFASSPGSVANYQALLELDKLYHKIRLLTRWSTLDTSLIVVAIKKVAQLVGVRLTKAKLAQIVPVIASLIGAGFNGHFTNRACTAAYQLYRRRFLCDKYQLDLP